LGVFIFFGSVNAQPPEGCIPGYIVLVIDRSGSMWGSRISDAKDAATEFTHKLLPDLTAVSQESLVSFASSATKDHDWSNNASLLETAINDISTGGGTNFKPPLTIAQNLLSAVPDPPEVTQAIIFLSDGSWPGDEDAAIKFAEQIREGADGVEGTEDDVIIFTIGLDVTADGERILTDMATAGYYYGAPNSDDLEAIYNAIYTLLNDGDGDSFIDIHCPGGTDEDDGNSCINPDAPEGTRCLDADGTCWTVDPADTEPPLNREGNVCTVRYYCETYQCAVNCNDGYDNDQDGFIDMNDTDCPTPSGLVPCGRTRDNPKTKEDERESCTICHIFVLMKRIIDFMVEVIALPLVVLMAFIGGFLFITAAGSESRIRKGKDIIRTAVIAVVIVLTGWLLINTLLFFLTGQQQAGIATILGQRWNEVQCSVTEWGCGSSPPLPAPPRCD
jgi:hypothetical protein